MTRTEEEYQEVLSRATDFFKKAQGINFALFMRNDDGKIVCHERHNQPCQGGEMRKYSSTHGEDCTRPNDRRPTDLKHPFPDGVPEAVAVKFQGSNFSPREFQNLLSNGPYSRVIDSGSWDFFDEHQAFLLLDTDVDSTAFVNLLQFIQSTSRFVYDDLLEMGFDEQEIPTILYLTSPGQSIRRGPVKPHAYYFSVNAAIHRVVKGEFTDLTGGTFRDRFDYNRPEIQDLYKAVDGETGTNFCQELSKRFRWRTYGMTNPIKPDPETGFIDYSYSDELVPICREIIAEAIKKEEERVGNQK